MKVDPNFQHDMYRMVHKPIRVRDQEEGRQFVERYMHAPQRQFEKAFLNIQKLFDLWVPEKTPQPRHLKDIVGFTKQLDNITNDITDQELRKLIALAVALWKEKGLNLGYKDIIRLFTGSATRVFDWFAFRFIVGEEAFGEEQGESDPWFISVPGVFASDPGPSLVGLYTFEQNFRDRSVNRNDAIVHGPNFKFFPNGPVLNSLWFVQLYGAVVEVPHHSSHNFAGNFTIEGYVKTDVAQTATLFKKSDGTKNIEVTYNSTLNQISYILDDGPTLITGTINSAFDLDDNTFRHWALSVDRTGLGTARLYFNGSESTAAASVSGLGDVSSTSPIYLGASGLVANSLFGSIDNVRIRTATVYNNALSTISVPSVSFQEYEDQQLDEFFVDIRIVDSGNLNRILVKRILNLMRPPSERIRMIFIKQFLDFTFGKGAIRSVVLGSNVTGGYLVLPPGAVEVSDASGHATFTDLAVQVRARIDSGGRFGVRFLIQSDDTFYRFVMRSDNQTFELQKVVGGVPTNLGAPIPAEVVNGAFYVLWVVTERGASGDVMIKTYRDHNLVFDVVDPAGFVQGAWGVESFASPATQSSVDFVELALLPIEIDLLEPNPVL